MIFPQNLLIYPGPIIKPFRKSNGHDLHQILPALVVFRQQHQVIVTVLSACSLFVETGIWCHIYFTAQNRLDSLFFCFLIKINHPVHDPMIGDCRTVHPQFLHPAHIFFDLIGSVEKTVFCMHMQMYKIHKRIPLCYVNFKTMFLVFYTNGLRSGQLDKDTLAASFVRPLSCR